MQLRLPAINTLLDSWLNEDIGRGDLTVFPIDNKIYCAHWITKQNGIFCGGPIIKQLFQRLDPLVEVDIHIQEGEAFKNNQKILDLKGPRSSLLSGERTSLNIGMHLSGIATHTNKLVNELEGTGVFLSDTRKTTPGLRLIEKYAIRCGGGINHRMGLDDAAMLKENHIAWSEGIQESIQVLRKNIPWTTKIIVEAETIQQAKEAVIYGADGVLLDEMTPDQLKQLVPRLRDLAKQNSLQRQSDQIVLEASGIKTTDLKRYAATGIDLISTSAPITQSSWVDFSMRFNTTTTPEE